MRAAEAGLPVGAACEGLKRPVETRSGQRWPWKGLAGARRAADADWSGGRGMALLEERMPCGPHLTGCAAAYAHSKQCGHREPRLGG